MRSCVVVAVWGQALSWSITTSCQKGKKHWPTVSFCVLLKATLSPSMKTISKNEVYQTQFCWEATMKFVENAGKVTKWWNVLFSWIFSSIARTKSSLTKDSQQLRGSSCTFSCHSLKCLTHLCTTDSLMACSPYISQSWQ
jgi:hypothetical protein